MNEVPPKLVRSREVRRGHQSTSSTGISVEYPDWHFNVRPSNTEPLLG
jgi:phosphomannomutase